jgi:anti-sigma-K factor RskA
MADHPVPHPDLAGYVLDALEPDASQAFADHLRVCRVCADEVAELADLPALLADAAPHVEVPIDLEARTFARIDDEARRGAGAPAAVRARQTRRVGSGLQRMLAVAAGFLLVAGAVGLIANLVSGSGGDRGTTIQLISANGTTARGEAKVRTTSQGREVALEVDGLPPAPAGFYYECWFVGDGDTLATPNRVSVGTFEVPDVDTYKFEMMSAARARAFPRMGVTLEPDDGNPQRTGEKVLTSVP